MALPIKREDRDAIIASALTEIIQGKSLRDVASAHGINHATLHGWLLGEVPEQYREIQREGLIARIVQADEELDNAKDHVTIARTRERCKFARWDAERRLKSLFAASQEITGPGGGPIQLDHLERARRAAFVRSLDGSEPIDVTPISQLSPTTTASS